MCEEESSVVMANEEMDEREDVKSNDIVEKKSKADEIKANNCNDENQEFKVIKSIVYENEKEEDVEKECMKCKTNKEISSCIEAMHETLVSELKKELFTLTVKSDEEEHENDEEAYLATDKMGKTIDDRFNIDAMEDGYAGGCVKGKDISEIIKKKMKSKEEEVKSMLKEKREEEEKRKVQVERDEES